MVLKTRICRLLVVWSGDGSFGARRVVQKPLVWLRWLVNIMLPSVIILTLYLEKIAAQLSSYICPIDMREPVFRLLRTWSCCTRS